VLRRNVSRVRECGFRGGRRGVDAVFTVPDCNRWRGGGAERSGSFFLAAFRLGTRRLGKLLKEKLLSAIGRWALGALIYAAVSGRRGWLSGSSGSGSFRSWSAGWVSFVDFGRGFPDRELGCRFRLS